MGRKGVIQGGYWRERGVKRGHWGPRKEQKEALMGEREGKLGVEVGISGPSRTLCPHLRLIENHPWAVGQVRQLRLVA